MDQQKAETFLKNLLNTLKVAQRRWCGPDVDDAEEMWDEYPSFINALIPDVEDILELPPSGLKILYAEYGAGSNNKDVKNILENERNFDSISLRIDNYTMRGDPAPGTPKKLIVVYTLDGNQTGFTIDEGQTLKIPQEL